MESATIYLFPFSIRVRIPGTHLLRRRTAILPTGKASPSPHRLCLDGPEPARRPRKRRRGLAAAFVVRHLGSVLAELLHSSAPPKRAARAAQTPTAPPRPDTRSSPTPTLKGAAPYSYCPVQLSTPLAPTQIHNTTTANPPPKATVARPSAQAARGRHYCIAPRCTLCSEL